MSEGGPWFQENQFVNLGRRSQEEGPKDKVKVFQRTNLGKVGPKDRLEMVSRKPTWAKKVPRID